MSGTNIIHFTGIDQTLGPGERKVVSGWSKRGKETDFFEPVTMFGDDLVITNTSGDTLSRDYRDLSNWVCEIDDRRATASHEYVLVVDDFDF